MPIYRVLHKLLQANYPNTFYWRAHYVVWGFEWGIYYCNVRVYVHSYMSVTLRNVNLHSFALTCTYAQELMRHVHWRWTCRRRTRKNGASWHWRTRRTALLAICNVRVLRSWVLNAADGWRHWERESNKQSQCIWGQEENKRKYKRNKHVVKSLHNPGIN